MDSRKGQKHQTAAHSPQHPNQNYNRGGQRVSSRRRHTNNNNDGVEERPLPPLHLLDMASKESGRQGALVLMLSAKHRERMMMQQRKAPTPRHNNSVNKARTPRGTSTTNNRNSSISYEDYSNTVRTRGGGGLPLLRVGGLTGSCVFTDCAGSLESSCEILRRARVGSISNRSTRKNTLKPPPCTSLGGSFSSSSLTHASASESKRNGCASPQLPTFVNLEKIAMLERLNAINTGAALPRLPDPPENNNNEQQDINTNANEA